MQGQKKLTKIKHSISMNQQNQKINSIVNYKELYEQEKNLRISIERQLEVEKVKVKKLISGKIKGKVCPNCLVEIENHKSDSPKESENVVETLKQFSSKIANLIPQEVIEQEQESFRQTDSKFGAPASKMSNISENVPIIENFNVYGVSEASMHLKDIPSIQDVGSQILYSLNPSSEIQKQASGFIFPTGVAMKRLFGSKAKDKAIEIMSFSYTNLKSFILGFKSPNQSFPSPHYDKNQLLNYVNKEKNLFFTCIGVRDYTWIEKKDNKFNISLDQIEENSSVTESNPSENQIHSEGTKNINYPSNSQFSSQQSNISSSNRSLEPLDLQIALTQRVFCISSYFPLFTFFEEILRSLINNIKMERLHMYKLNEQNMLKTIKQTDSKYQLERIAELFSQSISQLCNKKMQFNRSYEIKLINQQKISLLTDWNYAKTYFLDGWIFSILNMFTFEGFLDLWTQIVLQQGKGVVFICDNSHILTYTVYLFGNVLLKPFSYAYPVVNIVPQDEGFLDSPFPVIYGMFKKRKYVEQNEILKRYDDRTYVFLNPEKVQIIYSVDSKKNVQKRKPNKLKTQLSYLFKELKKYRRKQTRSTKYQMQTPDYCYLSNNEEKQISIKIVSTINEYIQNEIVQKIPSRVEIEHMNKQIKPQDIPNEKTPETFLIGKVVNAIKKISKDPFLERFLETQTFNNYVLEESEMTR